MSDDIQFDESYNEIKPRVFVKNKAKESYFGNLLIKIGLAADEKKANKIMLVVSLILIVSATLFFMRILRPTPLSVIQIEIRPGATTSAENIDIETSIIDMNKLKR